MGIEPMLTGNESVVLPLNYKCYFVNHLPIIDKLYKSTTGIEPVYTDSKSGVLPLNYID